MTKAKNSKTPDNYWLPPEWHTHQATLIVWPNNLATWKQFLPNARKTMAKAIASLSLFEDVFVCINYQKQKKEVEIYLANLHHERAKINFLEIPTNDCWVRDFGPLTVLDKNNQAIFCDWRFNTWGGKYPPWNDDDTFCTRLAKKINFPNKPIFFVLEGGSIDTNGEGLFLTTRSCLLNPNRNPQLNQKQIEKTLTKHLGARDFLWLENGIKGDDTDGHIDDITRFYCANGILSVLASDKKDPNYEVLKQNWQLLEKLISQKNLNIDLKALPQPKAQELAGCVLPLSYANFYIANDCVLVPVFKDKNDDKALDIISTVFPKRKLIPINCQKLLFGLGGLHCMTMQIPKMNQ